VIGIYGRKETTEAVPTQDEELDMDPAEASDPCNDWKESSNNETINNINTFLRKARFRIYSSPLS
jgi:hypothetical protein